VRLQVVINPFCFTNGACDQGLVFDQLGSSVPVSPILAKKPNIIRYSYPSMSDQSAKFQEIIVQNGPKENLYTSKISQSMTRSE